MTDINKIVNVTISTTPTFTARAGFGLMNIIGVSASLPLGQRYRTYEDLTDVGVDFGANTEEYKAAQRYFSASPKPNILAISRRFNAAVAGELLGGAGISRVLSDYTGITTGSFSITIDGVLKQVTGLDFSGAASLNAVAAIIQTRLIAAQAGTTAVLQDATRFKLTSGTTGPTSTISYAGIPAAGVDVSTLLGLTAATGAVVSTGSAIEAIATSLDKIQLTNDAWYGFSLTNEATEAERISAAGWAEAMIKKHYANLTNVNNLDPASVLSLGYLLHNVGYRRTLAVYNTDPYAAVAAAGRELTVDFDQPNSTITLKFKQLPSIPVVALTETQRGALTTNKVNYYTAFGGNAMLAEGVMSNGTFSDEVSGLDWWQVEIEDDVFSELYTAPTKIPQTDKGVARLVQAAERACEKAVSNGLLAPGIWTGAALGTIDTGDFLSKGYYVFAAPVADQSTPDRDARIAPPISIIARGAGALHSANIGVTFIR